MKLVFLIDELGGSGGLILMDTSVISGGTAITPLPVSTLILDRITIPTSKLDLRFLSNTEKTIKPNQIQLSFFLMI
jgi:hypothetical protein